ncbi:excisionase family DNA binding protein [Blastococcus xanthinilyticus]|uniref:Excisionase family DNA binding protein n=1 Tax=Blastococcus xanthinilyticus TaxID=1564164 RepID=A0A5S5CP03_9ACTN|nr:excisionase family DNA binding protein [Blastococcus xanthinilyticus]
MSYDRRAARPTALGAAPARREPASFLTAAEVAAEMRVSKMTVYRLAEELGAVRIGRSLRYPAAGVDQYLAGGGS